MPILPDGGLFISISSGIKLPSGNVRSIQVLERWEGSWHLQGHSSSYLLQKSSPCASHPGHPSHPVKGHIQSSNYHWRRSSRCCCCCCILGNWVLKSYGTFLHVIILGYHSSLDCRLLWAPGLRRTTHLLPAGWDIASYASGAHIHTHSSLRELLPPVHLFFSWDPPHSSLVTSSVIGEKTAFMLYYFLKSMASLPLRAYGF